MWGAEEIKVDEDRLDPLYKSLVARGIARMDKDDMDNAVADLTKATATISQRQPRYHGCDRQCRLFPRHVPGGDG